MTPRDGTQVLNDSISQSASTRRLIQKHLAHLSASGITFETAYEADLYTLTDPKEYAKHLNWQHVSNSFMGAIAFPFFDADGTPMMWEESNGHPRHYIRMRPDSPRHDRNGKPVKYESPYGAPNRLYIPPGARAALADPTQLILITEGEKKALCATQHGFPCIGIVGVYGWQMKRKKDPDSGKMIGPRMLIPDLAKIPLQGRTIVVVFDSDVVGNPNVQNAEGHFMRTLESAGAVVRAARIPADTDGMKRGLDDFLVQCGPLAFQTILDQATTPGFTRTPEEEISNDAVDDPYRLAQGFIKRVVPHLRFWKGEYLHWKDGNYEIVPECDLVATVHKHIRGVFIEANQREQAEYAENSEASKSSPITRKVTRTLTSNVIGALQGSTLLGSDIEVPAWINGATGPDPLILLPVQNGIVHIPTGELLKATPNLFTLNASPLDFDPEAPKPERWLSFLDEIWGDDPECIKALQEWFGYLLTKDTRQQKLLMMVGPTRSGKGTILRVLTALVGKPNVAAPSLVSLATNFGLWPLVGRSVAMVSDARVPNKGDITTAVENILAITGEDARTIDRKRRDQITMKLFTRFVIATNELPRMNDAAGALAGRCIILRMQESFLGREDHELDHRLSRELPGILLWSIEGYKRLHDRGRFLQPSSSVKIMRELEDLNSPVGAFVRERCVTGPEQSVAIDKLYDAWKSWCEEHGKREPGTLETFARDLRSVVPCLDRSRPRNSHGKRVNMYTRIRLKTHEEMSQDPEDGQPGQGGHSDQVLAERTSEKLRIGDSSNHKSKVTVTTLTNLAQHSPEFFRSQMLPD